MSPKASNRKIISAVIGYGAISWGLVEVFSVVLPAFNIPGFLLTWLIILLVGFLPFYILLLWRSPRFLNFLSFEQNKTLTEYLATPDGINRLLISKFKILKGADATDFLAVSLPEAIAGALVGIQKLSVQLDTSGTVANYNHHELAQFAVDRKLKAVLTGSILAVDNKVRISATLIEQPSNAIVWTESTQSNIGDLFELQDLIAQKIIKSLEVQLSDEEKVSLSKKNTHNAEAYELFLKANELSTQVERWEDAKAMYITCLEKDPMFGAAMARLARSYRLLGKYSASGTEAIKLLTMAEVYLSHSLRLDPQSEYAIALFAQLMVDLGKPVEALNIVLRRVNTSTSNAHLFAGLVHIFRFCGLLEESLQADRLAKTIDPTILTSVGHTYFMLGDYSSAKAFTRGDIGYLEAVSLAAMNLNALAIEKLTLNETVVDSIQLKAYLTSLKFALLGDREQAAASLDAAFSSINDGEALYYLTRTYAFVGMSKRALEGFGMVVLKGFFQPSVFARDQWLDGIRTDENFVQAAALAEEGRKSARRILESYPHVQELLKPYKTQA